MMIVLNIFAFTVSFKRNIIFLYYWVLDFSKMIVPHKIATNLYKLITYLGFLLFQVCRQAGYFKHAVYLAEKYDQHDL